MKERRNRFLTPGTERILRLMEKEEDGELVWSVPGGWWVGDEQVDGRCGMRLLRLVLLHKEDFGGEEMQRFTINEEGRNVLANPDYVPIIKRPETMKKTQQKLPRKWLKDPLFAKPKKGHEHHGWSEWQGTYTGYDARGCRRARCRCMHWCCYQQRKQRAKA